jgi:hypothetical protein
MRAQEEYNFTVLYEPAEEGGYVVKCPALPGLVTEGDTLEEARAMAKTLSGATWKASAKTACLSRRTKNWPCNPSKKR